MYSYTKSKVPTYTPDITSLPHTALLRYSYRIGTYPKCKYIISGLGATTIYEIYDEKTDECRKQKVEKKNTDTWDTATRTSRTVQDFLRSMKARRGHSDDVDIPTCRAGARSPKPEILSGPSFKSQK